MFKAERTVFGQSKNDSFKHWNSRTSKQSAIHTHIYIWILINFLSIVIINWSAVSEFQRGNQIVKLNCIIWTVKYSNNFNVTVAIGILIQNTLDESVIIFLQKKWMFFRCCCCCRWCSFVTQNLAPTFNNWKMLKHC